MLKRIVYTDFGQFVAALKSAERLGLHYRVERREVTGNVKHLKPAPAFAGLNPNYVPEYEDRPGIWVEYTLDILPDEDAATGEQATA